MSAIDTRFSPDYATARARFREATKAGEHGEMAVIDDLTVDWAWIGNPDAKRVLVYSSGVHGIEGFPGGAAQLETLSLPSDHAQLYLHAVNPWGWAHIRRVNEENVDLNRNFLAEGEAYEGAPPAYAQLDGLLNPATGPGGFDLFWLEAGWAVARHGFHALKNAVVSGQYQFPRGLFYGGSGLQAGPRQVLSFCLDRLRGRERVVHVDWHSALGAYAGRTLLLEGAVNPGDVARVRAVMGSDVRIWDASDPQGYTIRGGMTAALGRGLPGVRYDGLTCEFGTRSNLVVLAALRNENRLHHWGMPVADHPAKLALREAFAPADAAWKRAVLVHAGEVHRAAQALLTTD